MTEPEFVFTAHAVTRFFDEEAFFSRALALAIEQYEVVDAAKSLLEVASLTHGVSVFADQAGFIFKKLSIGDKIGLFDEKAIL